MRTDKPTMTATERESFAELDRLRAINAELIEALGGCLTAIESMPDWPSDFLAAHCDGSGKQLPVAPWIKARAALTKAKVE